MARSLLDRVTITDPCTEDWDAMPGDITRHCASCRKNVVNLDALGRHEAEAFLQRNRGRTLCVRLAVVAIAAGCGNSPAQAPRPAPTVFASVPEEPEPEPAAKPESESNPAPAPDGMLEPALPSIVDPLPDPDLESKADDPRRGTVTMGCACIPDDALCSCL